MLPFRSAAGFFVLVSLLFLGCMDDDPGPIPDSMKKTVPVEKSTDSDTAETPDPAVSKTRRRLSKEGARFREKGFLKKVIQEQHTAVNFVHVKFVEMLSFTGPALDREPPKWIPRDLQKIHSEIVRLVQRSPRAVKVRILKDLEIFVVFKEAYDRLDQESRLRLITQWEDRVGKSAPPEPESEADPLGWMRKNPIFWKKGGRFWWWAGNALLTDDGFETLGDGRIRITLPGGKSSYSS